MALNIGGLGSGAAAPRTTRRKAPTLPYLDTAWGIEGFASALDQLGNVSICDDEGRIVHVNDAFVRLSKYGRDELIGQTHAILKSSRHSAEFWADAYHTLAKGKTWRSPVMNQAKDGTTYWVDALIVPLKTRNGCAKGYLSIQIDITATVALHTESEERSTLLQTVVDNFPGGLTAFDKNHQIVLCNDRHRQMLDYPDELFANRRPTIEEIYRFNAGRGEYGPGDIEELVQSRLELASKAVPQTFERQRPNGTYLEVRRTPLAGGGFVTAHFDVTERKRDQETIGRLENHDALTGLPNRILFHERIGSCLSNLEHGKTLALHCLDLDRFKAVNETLGHLAGDALLKLAARRLGGILGKFDIVARLGGDEFVVMQAAPESIEDVTSMAKCITAALSEPFIVGDDTVSIGASVGIAIGPSDGDDAEQLMRNAEAALWRTKSLGHGTFGFFEHAMHDRIRTRHQIAAELREAIAANNFELHYQPIVNVKTRRIVGCEALIRWPHPERGLIPATEFVSIAEERGLIGQISDWVLKTACAEASQWPDDVWIAVNISAAQFGGQDLVDKVASASKGLSLSRLVLEITETLLMKDRDIAAITLERLKKLGVRFAIDDFGTGFSSLSYLQSFPFDKIKIDRSFVSDIANQKRSATLRRSIIQLGYNLGMTSVAEGVETEQQLDRLRAEGCVEAQGFLFSRAVPAAEIRTLFGRAL